MEVNDASLPLEIWLLVFRSLDNIDDALHLGRTCRFMNNIFEYSRLSILRGIILTSSTHKFDVQLCHFIDAFQTFSSQHLAEADFDDEIPQEARPTPYMFDQCLAARHLTDGQVHDVLARWQGLRVFEELYNNAIVKEEYMKPIVDTGIDYNEMQPPWDPLLIENACRSSGNLAGRKFSTTDSANFYASLTGLWLCMAAWQLARVTLCQRQTTYNRIWILVDQLVTTNKSVQESLQILESFDFVHGFLSLYLPILDREKFASLDINRNELDGRELDGRELDGRFEFDYNTWNFFFETTLRYLGPGGVLELLVLSSVPQHPMSRMELSVETIREYLDQSGHYHWSLEEDLIPDDEDEVVTTLHVGDLERACENALRALHGPESRKVSGWQSFRKMNWQSAVRGSFNTIPERCAPLLALSEHDRSWKAFQAENAHLRNLSLPFSSRPFHTSTYTERSSYQHITTHENGTFYN